MNTLSINNYYNISLHTNPTVPARYRNALLVSIMNYQSAKKLGEIDEIHRQIYPYIQKGTLEDLTRYTYYLFRVGDKEIVIAEPWILETEVTKGQDYVITLMDIEPSQLARIENQLTILGIKFKTE